MTPTERMILENQIAIMAALAPVMFSNENRSRLQHRVDVTTKAIIEAELERFISAADAQTPQGFHMIPASHPCPHADDCASGRGECPCASMGV